MWEQGDRARPGWAGQGLAGNPRRQELPSGAHSWPQVGTQETQQLQSLPLAAILSTSLAYSTSTSSSSGSSSSSGCAPGPLASSSLPRLRRPQSPPLPASAELQREEKAQYWLRCLSLGLTVTKDIPPWSMDTASQPRCSQGLCMSKCLLTWATETPSRLL